MLLCAFKFIVEPMSVVCIGEHPPPPSQRHRKNDGKDVILNDWREAQSRKCTNTYEKYYEKQTIIYIEILHSACGRAMIF